MDTDLRHNFNPIDFSPVVGKEEGQGVTTSSGFKYHLLKTMVLSYTQEFLIGYGIGETFIDT